MSHEPPAGGPPDWYTPPEVFARLGLEFDLDPCAPPWPRAHWIPAKRRIELPVDGFQEPWEGLVWLNPPYATETGKWVGKLADHPGGGIALVYNRCDTPWWQNCAQRATVWCFTDGRINFIDGNDPDRPRNRRDSRSGTGSCLLGFGELADEALRRSGLGVCSTPVASQARACRDLVLL